MIMLSGVMLVNSQDMSKEKFEVITGTQVIVQGRVPVVAKNEITIASTIKVAKNALKNKKYKSVKNSKKKAYKSVKKTSQKKKKVKSAKKKVVKKAKKKSVRMNVTYNKNDVFNYAYSLVKSYGWSDYDWECLVKLWNRESGWNPNAVNKRSGSCGIPQSLPCSKMAVEGTDYRTNYRTQIRWGLKYIAWRYGSPSGAWSHSQWRGWY